MRGFTDTATRFPLWARAYRDVSSRFLFWVRPYKDIATRFELHARPFLDVATRFKFVVQAFRDISTRFSLIGGAFADIHTRFRLVAQAYRDTATRFLVVIQAFNDIAVQISAVRAELAGCRLSLCAQTATIFHNNQQQKYYDIVTMEVIIGQSPTVDFTVTDPLTGQVSDADFLPTCDVFENTTDTPLTIAGRR